MKKKHDNSCLTLSRRTLIAWSVPTVTTVALPAHAQTSMCSNTPVMTATAPSKCSGSPPIGQAVLQIMSDGADPLGSNIEITAISFSGEAATDTLLLPSLPMTVSDSSAIEIEWTGNASDATSCLPLSTIIFAVSYRCPGASMDAISNFNMTVVLADAIP